ncbi:GPW/gp25 family protein [Microbacterium sp. G2-8]|uniref:GPW/gp25 family protein n=1 Tax=Microbacterium sp. G2-8 TaxID=2842454 RepID=UPI001C89A3A3|nr:GPW/gp25 family protein [Microbacterium sp. G2-8]
MPTTLRLPLEVSQTGALRTLTQDSSADLVQSIRSLLSTPRGERTALPEYGIIDQLGAVDIDPGDIAQAIVDWEPRVQEPRITEIATALAEGAALSTITVVV